MAYQNVSQQVRVLMYAPWYDVQDLIKTITFVRDINFNITESRQQALERLSKSRCEAPFGANDRFVNDRDFVCEFTGDWARKFQQLKAALSHKERDLRTQGIKDSKEFNDVGSVSDSQQAFWNASTAIYDQLVKLDGVWDLISFESHYRLRWVDAAMQPQIQLVQ